VKFLLDTHTFLWSLLEEDHLSPTAVAALDDPTNELHLSMASLWEATIKIASGKMRVPGQSVDYLLQKIEETGVKLVPILPLHLQQLQVLPRLHGDPFDRIILCQSIVEQMPIISADTALRRYQTSILW